MRYHYAMRLTAVILVSLVCACASGGNQVLRDATADTVSSVIVDGKTTKADVQKAFGDPSDTSFTDGGNDVWKYVYAHATLKAATFVPVVGLFAGGTDGTKKTLTIMFNKSDVVIKHTMSSSSFETRNGG